MLPLFCDSKLGPVEGTRVCENGTFNPKAVVQVPVPGVEALSSCYRARLTRRECLSVSTEYQGISL